jgi:hypothetical protein
VPSAAVYCDSAPRVCAYGHTMGMRDFFRAAGVILALVIAVMAVGLILFGPSMADEGMTIVIDPGMFMD